MSDIAFNRQTGEAVRWDGQAWTPVETARNPQTGAVVALVGNEWVPVDGAQATGRSTGEQVQRGVGLFGRGLNDAIGATVAAPVEAANWLMKQPGRALEAAGVNVPNVLPEGGFYTTRAQGALNALGRNDTPENTTERLAYGAGQGAGNVISMMAPAGAVMNMAAPGSMTRGVAQAMTAQPALQMASGVAGGAVGEATDSPVAGMAAGLAVPLAYGALRTAISPGGARPSAETRRLVEVAQAEGIPLTPGQMTGSRPLRTTESVFSTLPSTAGRQADINQSQMEAWNRAVLSRAGVQGEPLATPEVLQTARERIGTELGDLAARNTLQVNRDVMQSVQQVANEARRYLPQDKARPVLARIADFIDKIDTKTFKVEGTAYAKLDSVLSAQIRGESDGNVRNVLQQLRDALRAGMDASVTGQDAAAWADARRQYANLSLITRAMNAPNANTAAGNIPPAALSQAVATGPQRNFAMGRGDLNDLSRVGRAFIQDAIPNSGTPERLAIQGLLTGGLTSGGNVLSPEMLAGAAAGLALPRAAQMAYYSPVGRAYLTNQLADRILPRMSPNALRAIGVGQARGLLD